MEAHLCVCNNSYLIFVRNFQKMNRNAVPVLKKRTGTPFRCVPVQFEPWAAAEPVRQTFGVSVFESKWCLRWLFWLQNAPKIVFCRGLARTRLGELTTLPRLPSRMGREPPLRTHPLGASISAPIGSRRLGPRVSLLNSLRRRRWYRL